MEPNDTSFKPNLPANGPLSTPTVDQFSGNMPPTETLQNPTGAAYAPPPPADPGQPNSTNPSMPVKKPFPKRLIIFLIATISLLGLVALVVPLVMNNIGRIGGPAEITWWGLWEPDQVIQPLIDEYQASHPNVKITYQQQSKEDYRERLTSALASNNPPDIFRIHNTWVPMFRGSLAPVPSDVIAPSDYLQTFYPDASSSLTNGSEIVAIPLEFDSLVLYINDDIFDTYLKSPPTTWDELKQLALDLTVRDQSNKIQQAGVALGNAQNVDHWPEILALLMLQNQVTTTTLGSTNASVALDYYTRFQTSDHVWDDTLPTSTQMFINGRLAMYFGPSWEAHEITRLNPNLRFHTVTAPQLPKSRPDEPNLYYASYWAEGVNEDSKSKEVAMDFLKFMVEKGTLEKFYQNASSYDQSRKFGEPYPRRDMQELLAGDPIVGAVVRQGPEAKTWYLQSRTWDGPTGLNSQINQIYQQAINSVINDGSVERATETAAGEALKILAQYGLVRLPTPAPN